MDHEALRDASRRGWGEVAPGWETRHEWNEANLSAISDWLIDRIDPQPGQVVLDIAAGPGDLGHQIAGRVGTAGRVLSTDFAKEMVDVARRIGAARGLANVDYRTLDAERMTLEDDSVDAAVCRSGFMLMVDPGAALCETHRVLRSGGALSFSVFTSPMENPWVALPVMTFVERGHIPPPEPGGPSIFSLGDPDRIRELMKGASFDEPEIEAIDFAFVYADEDDAWNALVDLNGIVAPIIRTMEADELAATRRVVLDRFAPYRSESGEYRVPGQAWAVAAR